MSPCPLPLGYAISSDRYMKREDVGIVYQMNVAPQYQRSFVGAALLQAVFERAAYGCRLFCCWCAQDLEGANRFWEAMGFVPLAYRAGSRGRGRVHIFWQRRVRAGDVTTPWWYPSRTDSGSIREDRLVLPIPPGVGWRDVMPVVLPALSGAEGPALSGAEGPEGQEPSVKALTRARGSTPRSAAVTRSRSAPLRGLWFAAAKVEPLPAPKPEVKKPAAKKNDLKLVRAARELRDRWLEQVNAGHYIPAARPKYEVGRWLAESRGTPPTETPTVAGSVLPLLPMAA